VLGASIQIGKIENLSVHGYSLIMNMSLHICSVEGLNLFLLMPFILIMRLVHFLWHSH